ncbi:hypothetical protein DSAG12_03130 [Promethearchaeum syntrophicum]|uniref:Uncharacterized protein n=1 Tax=Promethearchaeum syntrophicum TaxID=2594042 RepID=A0A5B9DDH7_9ARCH|nr:hypothetical protein [Candidatus Prometheoarchaeum syntrophicum]QEE17298.1 hypothetical protein DSAG12_03130 [Candidatus Prometheoarchaeum syntrophicum]
MGIWKGKKKQQKGIVTQRCPKCLKANLRYASGISGLYSPAKIVCPDCGYKGSIYVDVTAEDEKEDLQLEMLRKEFPDLVEEQKSAYELAKITLKDKWHPNQETNHNILRAWCPFCADVNVVCSICKCPPEICSKHATEGLIGQLNDMYDDEIELCDVDPTIYKQIIQLFQNIIKEKS